jgi:hypothetical protein
MPLDSELERTKGIAAAAEALVRKRFDWSYSIEDDGLDVEYGALLGALGMTADEIAAPGRARSEALDAERRAKSDAERARRIALTQEERDAEDRAHWDAMSLDEQHQFLVRGLFYRAGERWSVTGSKDDAFGSWRIQTAEEHRASWCPEYACNGCGSVGKTPCIEGCSTKAANLAAIAKHEEERAGR